MDGGHEESKGLGSLGVHDFEADIPSRPESYYKYRLRGVLAHTGTADSGHYYSFIHDREPRNGNTEWLECVGRLEAHTGVWRGAADFECMYASGTTIRWCWISARIGSRRSASAARSQSSGTPRHMRTGLTCKFLSSTTRMWRCACGVWVAAWHPDVSHARASGRYLAVYDRIEVPQGPGQLDRQVSSTSIVSSASTHRTSIDAGSAAGLAVGVGTGAGAGAGAGVGSDSSHPTPSSAELTLPRSESNDGALLAPLFVSRLSSRVRRRRQQQGWLPPRIMQAVWRENVGYVWIVGPCKHCTVMLMGWWCAGSCEIRTCSRQRISTMCGTCCTWSTHRLRTPPLPGSRILQVVRL